MANQDDAKRKLIILASQIKGSTTYTEDVKLDRAIKAGRIRNRRDLADILQESLDVDARQVETTLANDDGDRLADEIVSLLTDK